jgi:hypothetical protein
MGCGYEMTHHEGRQRGHRRVRRWIEDEREVEVLFDFGIYHPFVLALYHISN